MKRVLIVSTVVALTFGAIPFSRAQSGGMKGMEMNKDDMMGGDKADVKLYKGVGTVKNVDPAAGTVTLQHGPIKNLDWPSMTMTFAVKDKAVLGKLSAGKKVEFEFVKEGTGYVVTSAK